MILVNVPQRPAESLILSPATDRSIYIVAAHGGGWPDCLCEGSPFSVFHMILRGDERKALGYSCPVILQKSQIPDFPGGPRWRVCLPMQRMWVPSLVWEDSTCQRATKPIGHNYRVHALEPLSHNCWAPVLQFLKPRHPGAYDLQQEKPSQWEACAPQTEEARMQ